MKTTHQTSRPRQLAFVNLILIVFLVAQSLMPVLVLATPTLPATTFKPLVVEDKEGDKRDNGTEVVYRTRIEVDSPARWEKLDSLGVVVLAQEGEEALVLVDQEQLETLARLRFEPHATDALETLVDAHARTHSGLVTSLQPLLAEAEAVAARPQNEASSRGLASLRAAIRATTPAQRASLAMLASTDSDGDGLNDTEEGWWCTDPNNPNSDGDADNYTDGQEIDALVDLRTSRQDREEYGPPFGPPNAWPDWNGQDGDPATPACNDGDYDTIPDQAEVFMVGSHVPEESTDGDKFDDGQELFGTTYCPGAPTSCGYGNYPRIEYWNYIQEDLPGPNWLKSPGDSIFVAAFPVPEVSVVPSSWRVERVTTVTTSEGQMTQTTNSYETSVTRGQGSSIADTVTWNEWEEVSEAVETPLDGAQLRAAGPLTPLFLIARVFGPRLAAKVAGRQMINFLVKKGIGNLARQIGYGIAGNAAYDVLNNRLVDNDNKDQIQPSYHISNQNINNVSASAQASASVVLNQNFDTQGIVNSLDGVQYAINQQGELLARGLHDVSYAISQPRFTETRTNGNSWGGSQETRHEVYEEHTISEGQAFTTGQNWETAWAVDSSHAADLTFNYTIGNSGTDYARELRGLIFNIYLGDDTEPSISYDAWEQFPDGQIENIFPGDTVDFSSTPIALTLEQMKRIDLGERLRVVVADYSYGADELFYQNAVNGGMTVFIEDGVDDGDELVDSYVIPTWGNDKVQEVLLRYFPAGYDDEGNLNALWTPEFGTSVALRQAASPPTWQEHYLSDISWWNVYLTQSDAGNTPLQDLQAEAGSALLFRFNRDSDRDGYKDSVELRYGTDKDDAASHPEPEVLAGYVVTREGNQVTVLLKLANTGTFHAYGIDAVMYSPDGTTTIDNNTVGGNGKVRPAAQVAVGSLVKLSDLGSWDDGTSAAKPYASGNYTGDSDRTYIFSVTTAGVIGQSGTAMSWSDGAGSSGTLDLGSNYQAPLPIEVAEGLEIGFNTGTIGAGTSFTVDALTPRDTFKYTINSEPYTPPVIVVSYSDPQGSHRFITPVELNDLASDLIPYGGQMLTGAGLDIITHDAVEGATANTTTFVFNNPHPATLEDANLYLNFVSDGQLVAEIPFTLTLEAGPTISPVTWSTDAFSQTYNADADNILIAFWTDSEGNIIDSAARPLNTFAEDPQPAFASDTSNLTWDFGSAAQGELLNHTLTLANTGFDTLLTHLNAPAGITISQADTNQLAPADNNAVAISLDTTGLPTGPYNQTLTLRTSDPDNPTVTVQVMGTITDDALSLQTFSYRPLDLMIAIPGDHQAHEAIEFTHPLGGDTESLHPALVVSLAGELLGTGNVVGSSYDLFGNGQDGELTVTSATVLNSIRAQAFGYAGSNVLTVSGVTGSGFQAGQQVFIHQSRGENAGQWEFKTIENVTSEQLILQTSLKNSYTSDAGPDSAQVLWVPQYRNLTINSGGTVSAPAWNGNTGGIMVVKAQQAITVDGTIRANGGNGSTATSGSPAGGSGAGYRGGSGDGVNNDNQGIGHPGEGINGVDPNSPWEDPNGNGGGAGYAIPSASYGAGGGGGNGTAGQNGSAGGIGSGGLIAGSLDLTTMVFGGGGGGSNANPNTSIGGGGAGAGIIFLMADSVAVNGVIHADGGQGGGSQWGGGSGAGGSLLIKGNSLSVGTNLIQAKGGAARNGGGAGGDGRIRLEYCDSLAGVTTPAASTQQATCSIIEQIDTPPYNGTRFYLPESFTNGRGYQIQYGRQLLMEASLSVPDAELIGDGRDGDLIVNSGETIYTDNTRTSLSASGGQNSLLVLSAAGFTDGDDVLIHQSRRGSSTGHWEIGTIDDINGNTLVIENNLRYSYSDGGSSQAQVLKLSQYENCTINSGGTLTVHAWDGDTGGVMALKCSGTVTVGGTITVEGKGYRAGSGWGGSGSCPAYQGESWYGEGSRSNNANRSGGGGGDRVGGGGGHATSAGNGPPGGGHAQAGQSHGQASLISQIMFGGGAGGTCYSGSVSGSNDAGEGGGVIMLFANVLDMTTGSMTAKGKNGAGCLRDVHSRNWCSAAGAGGSILIKAGTANLGSNQVRATKGLGSHGSGGENLYGPNGSDGRIHIESCNPLSGTASPTPNTQPLTCSLDNTDGQTTTLRVPANSFTKATLDALVSEVGVGTLTLRVDVGNDSSWDWQATSEISNGATFNSPDLANAFNAYWTSQGSPTSGTLDVPIRVSLSESGQVLLTNLVLSGSSTPLDVSITASDITFGASSPIEGDTVPISATLHNPGQSDSGALTVGFYATLPDFGDWYIGSAFVPNIAANGSIEASIQWNTLGFTGEVPIKLVVDPFNRLLESNEDNNQATKSMTILTRPDLMVSGIALEGAAREGLSANVELMLHNGGETDGGLQTVSLYEGDPNSGGTLIASQMISVSAGTTATLLMAWTPTTLGDVTLYVQADSDDVVAESDESNNLTSQAVYVGWGAPVEIDAGGTGDQAYDPDDGYGYLAPGTVIDSCGSEPEQTYRQAASGEALEYQFDHLLPGRFYHLDLTTFLCSGSRELRVLVDGIEVANPVTANNEVNRLSLLLDPALYADNQVVVSIERVSGLGGPVVSELTLTDIRYCYRDGGHLQEVPYANAPDGCGWLNGSDDQGWGTLPHQSVRYNDTGDNIQYLFDALQAGDAYQLNFTFYEGDAAGRTESVLVDGEAVLSDIALSNTPQYLTVDVPASAYSDGSILVEIAGDSLPIISEIALEQKTLGTSSSSSTSIPLVPGWNLISIPVHPESTVPADVLASIEDSYTLVQRYDRCNVANPWQTYDSSAPPVTNSLTEIDETMGLWIKLSVSDTLVVTGTVPISPSISLCTGWNLVGYPSLDSQPVADGLASITGSYTLVQAYFASEPTNDQWKTFDTEVPIIVNSLHDITAGQGYWIKVSQDVEWRP